MLSLQNFQSTNVLLSTRQNHNTEEAPDLAEVPKAHEEPHIMDQLSQSAFPADMSYQTEMQMLVKSIEDLDRGK